MSTAFGQVSENGFPRALARLRNQAALVRALVDELDRISPELSGHARDARLTALGAQLVEEFGRLGWQVIECALKIAGKRRLFKLGRRVALAIHEPAAGLA